MVFNTFLLIAIIIILARPNYLTEEDFARGRLLSDTPVNGTVFNPPHHPVEFPVSFLRNSMIP